MTQPDLFAPPEPPTALMKTIFMPKPMLDAWLEALRSGQFKKGEDFLKDDNDGCTRYCCLGVLQEINGGVEENENGDKGSNAPSIEWLEARGIKFRQNGRWGFQTPVIRTGEHHAALLTSLNDESVDGVPIRKDFLDIADMIERATETY